MTEDHYPAVVVVAGQDVDGLVWTVRPGASIVGIVKRPDGTPVEDVWVSARSTGGGARAQTGGGYETTNAALTINHQGQFPAITFSFNLPPGVALGDAVTAVDRAEAEIRLPASIQGSFAGTAQAFQASLKNEPILILAALLTVYIVLGMLYESLVHPVTILSTLPAAGMGALLALWMTSTELSVISMIALVLLIGIVKKNAIMMIDFAVVAEREHGKSPLDAVREACVVRFRPIMMTTMVAILAAVPLAVGLGEGSELRRPLGIAMIGGLLISQSLTLLSTPALYVIFSCLRERWKARRVRKRERRLARTAPRAAASH
jgi:multidrug efflux pump